MLDAIWGGGKSNGATACVPVIGAGVKKFEMPCAVSEALLDGRQECC